MGVFFSWKSVILSLGGSNSNMWLWPCQWCSGQSEWQLHHPWITYPSWFCWVHGTWGCGRLGRRVIQVRQKMWSVESWNHTVSITDVIIRVQNRKRQSLHQHLHQCFKTWLLMSFLYGVVGTSCFVDTRLSTVSVERTVGGRRESHARTVRTASSPESKRASLTFLIMSGSTSHQTLRIWSRNSWWGTPERGSLLWRFFTTPGCRHLQLPLRWQHQEYSLGWYYCIVRNLVVYLSFCYNIHWR